MDYTGLYLKYPVNRALTEEERQRQLKQKERLDVEPAYQLSVIKVNSNYMELVDKYFAWKGFVSGALLAFIGLFGGGWLAMLISYIIGGDMAAMEPVDFLLAFLAMGVICIAGVAVFTWLLLKESFAYTHYPVRLNRKTRMVHVFRVDGTVLSVPWDDVFFCLGSLRQGNWEIQGHVLDADRKTVKETFCAFPQISGNKFERDLLKMHWEFIRRYMEEGPQDAFQRTTICLPIADQRERVAFGFHRMHVEGTGNVITQLMAACMAIFILPGRWFSMQTSKIPKWPAEVEAVNQIEPGDRFARDASMNEKWREMPDWLWLLISGVFWAATVYWVSGLQPWR